MTKPFSQACENNQAPILEVLKPLLIAGQNVLEVGSGTGQHAVYFGKNLASVIWQTSDQLQYHDGIQQWINDAALSNVRSPIKLDVRDYDWHQTQYDAVFTANCLHIMSEDSAKGFVSNVAHGLNHGGLFIVYGPFNYDGQFSSESNARFNQWLKAQHPDSAIRDFELIQQCAVSSGLSFIADYKMPANNQILVWKKDS